MRYSLFIIIITTIYLLLSSNLEFSNILVGLLIALGITLLLKPQAKAFSWRSTISAFWALIRYLGVLMYDIIKGGIMVARLALSRNIDINPAIIAIPSGCDSEFATALSAHAISLSPGELVVEIDSHGIMYTHILDVTHSQDYTQEAQNLRRDLLQKIIR